MTYDLLITAVSERADLFAQSLESLLDNVDQPPARVVAHEDVRPGSQPGEIRAWLEKAHADGRVATYVHQVTSPALGFGPAMRWVLEAAQTPIVLYTQEDWLVLRTLPVSRALALMEEHGLHHVRFNKRKTMRAKHDDKPEQRWEKIEVKVGGQVLCISDHWYTQTSLWRVAAALPAVRKVAEHSPQANQFVARLNDAQNTAFGDGRSWDSQQMRHERLRTYIWGPVGEPAFIRHLGSLRTTGPIVHVSELKG